MYKPISLFFAAFALAALSSVSVLAATASQTEGAQPTRHGTAKVAGPVTWGSPDQPYGKRRSVTDADRKTIQSYRSGHTPPIFSTNFTDPAELQADWSFVSDDNSWGDFKSCRRPANAVATSEGLRLETLVVTDCRNRWSTGYINSKAKYRYGFFEATMKIANIKGMNNAFWMTTEDHPETGDHFEIDVCEAQYPNYCHIGLQQYPAKGNKTLKHTGMGWGVKFVDDLSSGFHDYGVLWTPTEMIFEIDGEPVAAVVNGNAVRGPTDIALSSALIYAGIPTHPEEHDVVVQSLRVFAYQK